MFLLYFTLYGIDHTHVLPYCTNSLNRHVNANSCAGDQSANSHYYTLFKKKIETMKAKQLNISNLLK